MSIPSASRLALAFAVCALLFAVAAQAQTVRANIPFAFVAGDRLMPAGEYRLVLDGRTGILQLQPSGDLPMFLAAHRCQFSSSTGDGALIFHKYGDSHFLKRVKTAATLEGFEFLPTRGERDAARRTGTFEVATINTYGK